MHQENFRKKIVKYTIVLTLISAVIIASSVIVVVAVRTAEERSYTAYVDSLVSEYRLRFQEQMASDLETLHLLEALMEKGLLSEETIVSDQVRNLSDSFSFVKVGYYDIHAEEYEVHLPDSDSTYEFANRPAEAREAIRSAWEGETAVSQVYEENGIQAITYAVPVYEDGGICGALTAIRELDAFCDIINSGTTTGDSIHIFWIGEDGSVIAASEGKADPEDGSDLILLSESAGRTESSQEGISRQTVRWKGASYTLYCASVGDNGWSLIYIDNGKEIHSPIYSMIILVAGAFAILFLACITVIIYTYKNTKKDNRRIRSLAEQDQLTGIENLSKFQQETDMLLAENPEYCMAVINFRHFQYINDIFGMDQADELLVETAALLKRVLRENERCCREKTDQFYLLLAETDEERIRRRLEKILEQISGLAAIFHKNYTITLYCGVALEKQCANREEQRKRLLADSEFALKMLKNGHGNEIAFYDQKMHEEKQMSVMIESSRQEALENGEFHLYLQAKKDLRTGRISGAEALVRWIRKDGTMIYPDRFIPVFEKDGFCAQLDLHMVELVCEMQRTWLDMGMEIFPISVNQSKLLFYQEDYIDRLCEITDRCGIPRKYLVLEILEGLAAENLEELNRTIFRLKEQGFQISMDDFGSGYSSLNILSGLEIDEVKLDREFLLSMGTSREEKQKAMMRNVVQIARDLGIRTVAEGVETETDEKFLREIDCSYGQGYYYSRPMPAEEFGKKFLHQMV